MFGWLSDCVHLYPCLFVVAELLCGNDSAVGPSLVMLLLPHCGGVTSESVLPFS